MVKAYPKYKESGAPWFGDVPDHWETPRLGSILMERKETNKANDVTKILSVMKDIGVIPYEEKGRVGNKCSEDITRYKIVRPGDIVANCMNIIIGSVGLSKYTGCLSPVYYVLTPRLGEGDSRYFDYVFKVKSFQRSLVRLGNGILAHRMRIPMELLKCEVIPEPPLLEQKAIAEYLDGINKMFRSYIRSKQQVVKLLNEQKQAIINNAVTCGINPDARFTPSGVEWLGDVPEHWEIKPLKHWAKINQQVLTESTQEDFEFSYLDIGSVGTGALEKEPQKMFFKNAPSRARRIVRKGDTIISTVRTYLKAVYFIHNDVENLIASTGFAVLTPKDGVCPELLSFLIQSNYFIDLIVSNSVGVAYPAIAETRLGSLKIAMPIDLQEQRMLADAIKTKTKDFDRLIDSFKKDIFLIREYHQRLISDVVTGKIDIRTIKLPDIEEALQEPIDEQGISDDIEDSEEVVNADE